MNHTEQDPQNHQSTDTRKPRRMQILDEVSQLAEKAKAKGKAVVNENSTKIGAALSTVADKSDAARGFIEQGYEQKVAPAFESAQQRLRETSDYLQSHNSASMSDDLTRVAKRHPKATAGILFGLGFLIARKLYSSK